MYDAKGRAGSFYVLCPCFLQRRLILQLKKPIKYDKIIYDLIIEGCDNDKKTEK